MIQRSIPYERIVRRSSKINRNHQQMCPILCLLKLIIFHVSIVVIGIIMCVSQFVKQRPTFVVDAPKLSRCISVDLCVLPIQSRDVIEIIQLLWVSYVIAGRVVRLPALRKNVQTHIKTTSSWITAVQIKLAIRLSYK